MPEDQCHALTPRGANNEELIPCLTAFREFGISVRHGRMSTNGELRFRLNCADGSAYIRTQTASDSQGWQAPHFHNRIRETYIVEAGWIGYAELKADKLVQRSYAAGQVFTTEPGVVHNIYMPATAVIHTVKHGADASPTAGSDWHGGENYPDTQRLAKMHGVTWTGPTETVSTALNSGREVAHGDPEVLYNAAYRHFDSLIWQAPAWSSALFSIVVASVNSLLTTKPEQQASKSQETFNTVAQLVHLSTNQFAAAQLALFGVFTLVLAYALYRFRWHQINVKTWSVGVSSPRVSPQTLLQLVIVVEAAILLFLAFTLAGVPLSTSSVAIFLVLGSASYWWENSLSIRQRTLHPPSRRTADTKVQAKDQGGS